MSYICIYVYMLFTCSAPLPLSLGAASLLPHNSSICDHKNQTKTVRSLRWSSKFTLMTRGPVHRRFVQSRRQEWAWQSRKSADRCSKHSVALPRRVLTEYLKGEWPAVARGGSPGAARQVPAALGRASPSLRGLFPQLQMLVHMYIYILYDIIYHVKCTISRFRFNSDSDSDSDSIPIQSFPI